MWLTKMVLGISFPWHIVNFFESFLEFLEPFFQKRF